MDRLRELILLAEGENTVLDDGTVVLASSLSDGCGRFGRYWHAPKGGLWLAVALADTLLSNFSRLLPFCIGVACCRTIQMYHVPAAIKWVNDIHVNGLKIAGILSETVNGLLPDSRYHLIGIGININNSEFPEEIAEIATSIRMQTGTTQNIETFGERLLAHLAWSLGLLRMQEALHLKQNGTHPGSMALQEVWMNLSDTVGKKVIYGFNVQEEPQYRAVVNRIDDDGGLVMTLEDGRPITEYSGEIIYLDHLDKKKPGV